MLNIDISQLSERFQELVLDIQAVINERSETIAKLREENQHLEQQLAEANKRADLIDRRNVHLFRLISKVSAKNMPRKRQRIQRRRSRKS